MKVPAKFLSVALSVMASISLASPTISHEAIKVAIPGDPLTVIANVSSDTPIENVYLHFTQSKDISPTKVKMKSTGVGAYFGSIPASFTRSGSSLNYYIEASDKNGEWKESPWFKVSLNKRMAAAPRPQTSPKPVTPKSPAPYKRADQESITDSKWFWPAIIGGGIAVVGAVALSSSDSGGGSSTTVVDTTPTGPTENSLRVGASDNQSTPSLALPRDTVIDASGALAGRTVTSVRVTMNYNPADTGGERFTVTYNGSTIIDTGVVTSPGQAVAEVSGSSTQVIISVLESSEGENGGFNYNWDATAFFIYE